MSLWKLNPRTAGLLTVGLISVGVLVIGVVYVEVLCWYFADWSERALVGGALGGLSAVFSGLGLIGVAVALAFQALQLRSQTQAVLSSLEEQAAARTDVLRLVKALALGASANVLELQLGGKLEGYGSDELRARMEELDRLVQRTLEEIDSATKAIE
ncbi:MAG: hypothetical protein KDD11_16050 [Acidobacteria bacterium]|nr:hypothetical protein [Acidobacteriota bacterium]